MNCCDSAQQILVSGGESASKIQSALQSEGHRVDIVNSIEDARRKWHANQYDLVILDDEGAQHHHATSLAGSGSPVIVLSRSADAMAASLDAGADYFVQKSDQHGCWISNVISQARAAIRYNCRRRQIRNLAQGSDGPIRLGNCLINLEQGWVTRDGKRLNLSTHEFKTLSVLVSSQGRCVTREFIGRQIYDSNMATSNTLEVFIHGLRRAIGKEYVLTHRGVGYSINPDLLRTKKSPATSAIIPLGQRLAKRVPPIYPIRPSGFRQAVGVAICATTMMLMSSMVGSGGHSLIKGHSSQQSQIRAGLLS